MQAVASASESVLSAREAVSDFGFRFTLGDENVFGGTEFHKGVLKNAIYTGGDAALAASLKPLVEEGLRSYFQGTECR